MVRKVDKFGTVYHEPPYTKAEEMEIYRRSAGVRAFTRPVGPKTAPASPPPAEGEAEGPQRR